MLTVTAISSPNPITSGAWSSVNGSGSRFHVGPASATTIKSPTTARR